VTGVVALGWGSELPATTVTNDELAGALGVDAAALEALPSDEQAVVRLAYFRGLSQSEVAAALGIPLGTVKSRLRRAFGRLRESLAGLEDWVV